MATDDREKSKLRSEPLEERILICWDSRRTANLFSVLRNVFRGGTFLLEDVLLLAKNILLRNVVRLYSLSDDVIEADVSEKAMILDVINSMF